MKTIIFQLLICALFGYLLGSINPSYIASKIRGFDIRNKGTGNAGASNAIVTMGKGAGILCAIFDIFKAYFAFKISVRLFPLLKLAGLIAGVFCILGHVFPIFMNFKGGKGLACLGGVILATDAKFFFIILFFELILALIIDYICVVPTSGSFIFMIYLWFVYGLIYGLTFLPAVIVIFFQHIENFLRIKYGIEGHFSFLWNKEKEIERLQKNWNKLNEKQQSLVKTKPSTIAEDIA